jgi:5,10-methylenetetrahydromethanopterin reductase
LTKFGVHIVPLMPADAVVELGIAAERIGYDYCLVADEGFHPDVYACMGAIARETDTMRIGPATNGYTRHPAVTAAAVATIDELSGGRAFVTLLAGGSMVLSPMGIPRERPYRVVRDTIEVLRALWSGEVVDWDGEQHSLRGAQLGNGARDIPIWITSRGPLLLRLAGRSADGALLTVKPDLDAALEIVEGAAAGTGGRRPERIYLGRIAYTPEMVDEQRRTIGYVLMDSPERVLQSLGFDGEARQRVFRAAVDHDPESLADLITDDLLRDYQINGTPEECSAGVAALVATHGLDTVLVDVLSHDLEENLALLHDTHQILSDSQPR